ncbi:enoyl-CoA hydratase-related protein [Fodinicurvata halophila]|uniref:Enoyl-CoA hydratase-related protein n=1 Tax=Fodinicurvata halophila TaxID=1419723 RepID=A0ABV8UL80_9PROT
MAEPAADSATVLYDRPAEGVTRITLNRPKKLNSITVQLRDELVAALERAGHEENVRCIILTGAGRAFCAGQDLGERRPVLEGEAVDLGETLEAGVNRIVRGIRDLPKPVVCAVNGVAAGAGANIALACDIVVAARSASFIQSFMRLGLIPDGGGTWSLPRLVGSARATGMVMLARPVSAEDAESWGLIWQKVEDAQLECVVSGIAGELVTRSPDALALAKQALHVSTANTLDQQLDLERDLQRKAGFTEAYREALAAFFK